ncbi:unnamed protein product [Leptidea sinapis]|uniref:PiggyBac transposable element-derived protein domain-containing protein n=1 Tax=Leptidea sinapis TaxID=189913 RepID=A0A5E4QJT0_9NEOP|nr:unnamed protein product [Leptidea sinapis]
MTDRDIEEQLWDNDSDDDFQLEDMSSDDDEEEIERQVITQIAAREVQLASQRTRRVPSLEALRPPENSALSEEGSSSSWTTTCELKKNYFTKQNEFLGAPDPTPIAFFNFFLEDDFLAMICDKTNAQAEKLFLTEGFALEIWPKGCQFGGALGSGQLQYTIATVPGGKGVVPTDFTPVSETSLVTTILDNSQLKVGTDPVKLMPDNFGDFVMVRPNVGPSAGTKFTTPDGRPASLIMLKMRQLDNNAVSDGFHTTPFPMRAAIAATRCGELATLGLVSKFCIKLCAEIKTT